MEKAKQMSDLSSSFTAVLFGPNDSSKPSSSGLVESIFGPNDKHGNSDYMTQRRRESSYKKERSSIPCHYNSSIYYGAQDVYSPTSQNTIPQHNTFNKDGDCASRGNWWKGKKYFCKTFWAHLAGLQLHDPSITKGFSLLYMSVSEEKLQVTICYPTYEKTLE